MTFSAIQIAKIIEGKIEGNPEITVDSFGKIEEARSGQISFLANLKYEDHLYTTKASVIIINDNYTLKSAIGATLIRVHDAYSAFATLLSFYQEMVTKNLNGIQQPCYIDKTASYGQNIFIGAFAYLGENVKLGNDVKIFPGVYLGNNVSVGDNSIIHPGVKIYKDCIIGNDVIIHAGTVIGSDGFGFAPQTDGAYQKIPQLGNVVIEDRVEIGSNCSIDRATLGSTLIKSGAKLDNLIQVAHNVEIGNSTVIAALTGISGSTKLGNSVMVGGQAGLAGHIHIGDGARINGKSGVSKSVEPGKSVSGTPAQDFTVNLRNEAMVRRLPELEKRIKELEKLVKQLLEEKV